MDFADDLALLSHKHQQMQDKVKDLQETSSKVGLNIHKGKTKLLKVNNNSIRPVILEGEALEEVESFKYLGSIVDKLGRMKMSESELVKQRHYSYNSRTFGVPRRSAEQPNCAF